MIMKNIAIIIPKNSRGWFYPIFKWRKELLLKGLKFSFISQPKRLVILEGGDRLFSVCSKIA